MTDTDSYLLKCTLEAIADGKSTNDIQFECECKLGFRDSDSYDNNQ